MPNTRSQADDQVKADLAHKIAGMLQEIKFGSIEIIVHENKVVQIERREKLRFDNKATTSK
ncbi:MAG: YezD family protein [Methylococcales bacterium]